ncbi:hypothetical protein MTO96_040856 [Rhipicephalus appendiculatus]
MGLVIVEAGEGTDSPPPVVGIPAATAAPPASAPPLLSEEPVLVPLRCAELTVFSGTATLTTPPLLLRPLTDPSPPDDPPPLDALAVTPDTPLLLLAFVPPRVWPALPVAVITVVLVPETAGT